MNICQPVSKLQSLSRVEARAKSYLEVKHMLCKYWWNFFELLSPHTYHCSSMRFLQAQTKTLMVSGLCWSACFQKSPKYGSLSLMLLGKCAIQRWGINIKTSMSHLGGLESPGARVVDRRFTLVDILRNCEKWSKSASLPPETDNGQLFSPLTKHYIKSSVIRALWTVGKGDDVNMEVPDGVNGVKKVQWSVGWIMTLPKVLLCEAENQRVKVVFITLNVNYLLEECNGMIKFRHKEKIWEVWHQRSRWIETLFTATNFLFAPRIWSVAQSK